MVLVQLGLGYYLHRAYDPSLEGAHRSVTALRESGLSGFLQNFHYWGSAWLILHGLLHVLGLLLTGAYLRIPKVGWLGAVLALGGAFLAQISGNLLPFDRHDVQTAVIEGGIASRMPLAGEQTANLMMGGDEFGQATLSAWHGLHVWLWVPLALAAVLLFSGHKTEAKPSSAARFFWVMPLTAVAVLSASLAAPYGPGATPADFNAYDARPSWYTWPLHGALNTFDSLSPGLGWIGAGLLPGLFAGLLVFAPWIGARADKAVRPLVLLLAAGFLAMGAFKGGTPAPIAGLQDVPEVKQRQSRSQEPVDEVKARLGLELARQQCAPCHGDDLRGKRTPDLTRMHERFGDAEWYIEFLRDPQKVKPGTPMPNFRHLNDEQFEQLAEWLRQPK